MRARLMFENAWRRLESRWHGRLAVPREIVWLNGAPGSGKGTNIPFIVRSRGLSRAVGMSALLENNVELKAIVDRGELVPDGLVLDALLDEIFSPERNDGSGLVVDGFPRTALQVDLVKVLYDRLVERAERLADLDETAAKEETDQEEKMKRGVPGGRTMGGMDSASASDHDGDTYARSFSSPSSPSSSSPGSDYYSASHLSPLSSSRPPLDPAVPPPSALARPSFKVVILYVDEEESVRRQMRRARMASLHNARVADAGTGDLWSVRATDASERLCRRRYQVFRSHYHTILRLKSHFPFSLIDAMGTVEECRAQITRELRYQSSLDLAPETYAEIRHLPLARDLVRCARQHLVTRLDGYRRKRPEMLRAVVATVKDRVVPLVARSSLAGFALFRTSDPLFDEPAAVEALIDVLSDRGFAVSHVPETRLVPTKVDLETGDVRCRETVTHAFRIRFDPENVRDLSTPLIVTTHNGGEDVAIGSTSVPAHLQCEDEGRKAEAAVVGLPPPAEGRELAAARAALRHERKAAGKTTNKALEPTEDAHLLEQLGNATKGEEGAQRAQAPIAPPPPPPRGGEGGPTRHEAAAAARMERAERAAGDDDGIGEGIEGGGVKAALHGSKLAHKN